jgi:myosin heavy subunit
MYVLYLIQFLSQLINLFENRTGPRLGILVLMNEECMLPKGSDMNLVSRIIHTWGETRPGALITRDRLDPKNTFRVKHFAGQVTYV